MQSKTEFASSIENTSPKTPIQIKFSLKYIFFLFTMLWIARTAAQSESENNKCQEDHSFCQTHFIDSACFLYCEYGLHTGAHDNICNMIDDKVISLEEALKLPEEQFSRLNSIDRIWDGALYSMLESRQIPMMHLLNLSTVEFHYFDQYYHEQVIGLSQLIHEGKLSYHEALTMIRNGGLPYQLNSIIIHHLILNNKLSIDEAAHIDGEAMNKLTQYNKRLYTHYSHDKVTNGYHRLIGEADLGLQDFLNYPIDFISHILDNYYLIDSLVDKSLTLDAMDKLYRLSGTFTPAQIDKFGTKFYRVTDFKGFPGSVRLLDLIIQKIVDVDFVVRLSYRQATQLNACAEMINEGLRPSEVLAIFDNLTNAQYKQFSDIVKKKENRMFIIKHNLLKKSSLITVAHYAAEQFEETMVLVQKTPTLDVLKTLHCINHIRSSLTYKASNLFCNTMKFFQPNTECEVESKICDNESNKSEKSVCKIG